MRKSLIYTILAAFALLSCGREPLPDSPGEGTGELMIRIAAPMLSGTKAGTAADGDVMKNLHIWLVDPAENVVRYASWNGADGDIVMDSRNSTAKAKFTNISRGSYTVYFIANKPTGLSGLSVPLVGGKIDDAFKKYVLSGFENNAPDFRTDGGTDDGMPLSLVESISISAGSNSLSAELIRACGRIRVSVRNNTLDKNIFLQSVVLGEKNPNRGYLFPQDDHSVPSDISYGPFEDSFSHTTAGERVSKYVVPGDVKTIIDQYIYESGGDGVADMGLSFSGGVFEKTTTEAVLDDIVTEYTYSAGTECSEYNEAMKDSEGNPMPMIIRNKSANYFVKASGSSVLGYNRSNVNELLAGSDVKDYIWQIEESYGYKYIRNLGTNKYLTIGRNGTNVTVESDKNDINIASNSKSGSLATLFWYAGYNMCSNGNVDGNSIVAEYCWDAPTEDRFFWYMTPVTITTISYQPFVDALKSFSKSLPNINYLNDFGVAVPLTQICRNEDVNIVINVFYNPEYALVYFDVEAWTGVNNETTFD